MANFVSDLVDRRPPEEVALVAVDSSGRRREWTFGEIALLTRATSAQLEARGVRRGDVVVTMCGTRIEWVLTLLACLRIGAVAAPYSPMLRTADIRHRATAAPPVLVVADVRHLPDLTEAGLTAVLPVSEIPTDVGQEIGRLSAPADLGPTDPAFLLFTSGSTGTPKPVWHGQRYVWGQELQAAHWLGLRAGDVLWSTAAPGWSKSTRNTFIAPWLSGASAVLHDGRFDAAERLRIARAEHVSVLCMAPTEWRRILHDTEPTALPDLRRIVAAGEPLDSTTIAAWRQATGLVIADGYGQTETGHLAASTVDAPAPPGSVGRPLPGVVTRIHDGELQVDAETVPTLSLVAPEALVDGRWWPTGDLFDLDEDGFLYFRSRADDVILSSGYRIDPVEVEKALRTHPDVVDCLVAGVPDALRGEVVAALVVVRDGCAQDSLRSSLQEHVRTSTAPYKYPRVVTFVPELPRTSTGKPARGRGRELLAGEAGNQAVT